MLQTRQKKSKIKKKVRLTGQDHGEHRGRAGSWRHRVANAAAGAAARLLARGEPPFVVRKRHRARVTR